MAGPAAPPEEDDVLLGVVLGAHGLRGEVKVKTFTADPGALGAYGPVRAGDGRQFLIAGLRSTKADEVVVKLKGISDRDAAQSLKGEHLYVPRAALPEPEDDEYYHLDLVGLRVEDGSGRPLGQVRGVHNFGAGDVVEIESAEGAVSFVPFTREAVPTVDLAGGRLIVSRPKEA
jgi:16S rRNA processing protein RimM